MRESDMNRRCMIVLLLASGLVGSASAQPGLPMGPGLTGPPAGYPPSFAQANPYAPPPGYYPQAPAQPGYAPPGWPQQPGYAPGNGGPRDPLTRPECPAFLHREGQATSRVIPRRPGRPARPPCSPWCPFSRAQVRPRV